MDSYPHKLLLQFNEDNMKFCDWLHLWVQADIVSEGFLVASKDATETQDTNFLLWSCLKFWADYY
jgi:hypothetical protein